MMGGLGFSRHRWNNLIAYFHPTTEGERGIRRKKEMENGAALLLCFWHAPRARIHVSANLRFS